MAAASGPSQPIGGGPTSSGSAPFLSAYAWAGPGATFVQTGAVAKSQSDLSGYVLGAYASNGNLFSGTFGSFNGAGQMSGYYLGGIMGQSSTPIYQDRVYREAYVNVCHERQAVTTNTPGRMWDVWFDHQDGQKTQRRSPIVLDLNGNGKPDITGKNVLGDGKVSGEPVMFDIDPSRDSWQYKSVQRRPGHGAPKISNGTIKYEDGTTVKLDRHGRASEVTDKDGHVLRGGRARREARQAERGKEHGGAQYYDKDGNQVGELSRDEKTGKMMYHWGKREEREKTEWLAKGGGDGLLVWDVDNDGKISSSKELFGEFDVDGKKKFSDGYQKLATHFDKNHDGRVEGAELAGLKIWKDANGDGKTDAGELQSLSQNNITSLNVSNIDRSDMSSTFNQSTTSYRDVTNVSTGWHQYTQREQVGWQNQYFGGFAFGGYWS